MQGRLTKVKKGILQFQPSNWKIEFDRIKKVKLDYIELFTSKFNDKSPIWNFNKLILKKKIKETNLKKIILCENYVFDSDLLSKKYLLYIKKLIDRLAYFDNSTIIIPIEKKYFKKINRKILLNRVSQLISLTKNRGVDISFEIDISPTILLKFRKNIKNKDFKITFDTGNIFLINKKNKSLVNYFKKTKKIINHIHIKDRDVKGNNVVLGQGKINFNNLFKEIKKIKYDKTFTFETHRGKNFLSTAVNNLNFVTKMI